MKSLTTICVVAAGASALFLASSSAFSATVTFDEGPSSNGLGTIQSINEAGFTVSATGRSFWISDGTAGFCYPECPVKDSQYLMTQNGGEDPILMANSAGTLFNLISFEYGESHLGLSYPSQINVIGYLHGGGTVSTSFSLDGINDGSGPLNDFQLAVLPESFRNLTSVEFSSPPFADYSLDTIVLTPVPIPSALWMFSSGLFGLLGMRKRNRSATSQRERELPR